jgi:hypothetical protein
LKSSCFGKGRAVPAFARLFKVMLNAGIHRQAIGTALFYSFWRFFYNLSPHALRQGCLKRQFGPYVFPDRA